MDQREFEYKEDGANGTMRNFSVPFTTCSGEESLVSYIKTANKSNDSQAGLYASINQSLSVRPTARHAGVDRQHTPFRITEVSL